MPNSIDVLILLPWLQVDMGGPWLAKIPLSQQVTVGRECQGGAWAHWHTGQSELHAGLWWNHILSCLVPDVAWMHCCIILTLIYLIYLIYLILSRCSIGTMDIWICWWILLEFTWSQYFSWVLFFSRHDAFPPVQMQRYLPDGPHFVGGADSQALVSAENVDPGSLKKENLAQDTVSYLMCHASIEIFRIFWCDFFFNLFSNFSTFWRFCYFCIAYDLVKFMEPGIECHRMSQVSHYHTAFLSVTHYINYISECDTLH